MVGGPAQFGDVTAEAFRNGSEVSEELRSSSGLLVRNRASRQGVGRAWRAVCAVIGPAALPACTALPGCPQWTAAPGQRPQQQRCTCQPAPRSPSCGGSGQSGGAQRSYNTTLLPLRCQSRQLQLHLVDARCWREALSSRLTVLKQQ